MKKKASRKKTSQEALPASQVIGGALRTWMPKNQSTSQIASDMPVIVDAVKEIDKRITRCVYFSIEADTLGAPFILGLGRGIDVPFQMIELTGVVSQPSSTESRFTSPGQLDDLFEAIENSGELLVSPSYLFFPSDMLQFEGEPPSRGDVFRIGPKLMTLAYLFATEQVDYDHFERGCKKLGKEVVKSPGEARVFHAWGKNQITESLTNYARQDDAGKNLKWEDRP